MGKGAPGMVQRITCKPASPSESVRIDVVEFTEE